MSENVLRARSVTELVDAAVQLLRQHYTSLIIVSGIGMAPGLILQPMLSNMLNPSGNLPSASDALGLLAVAVFSWVWYSIAGAAIIVAASQAYLEGHVDVAGAFRRVLGRVGAILYASFVKGFTMALGAILLLIGMFYFYATYFAVPTTIVVEGLSGPKGLKRSRTLAEGHRWRVLGPTVLVYCIYFLIILAVSVLSTMMLGKDARTLQGIVSIIIRILVFPVVPITELLVYYDLRIRVEGYDVEVMASKLDGPVTTPAA